MLRKTVSAVVVAASFAVGAAPAWAIDYPLPNGDFAADATAFPRTITSWTTSFAQTSPGANPNPLADTTGTFSSFGAYVPQGGANSTNFAFINNLGYGLVQLQSAIFPLQNNFYINFGYVYLTNADPSIHPLDAFRVTVDFYADAAGTTQLLPSQSFDFTPTRPLAAGAIPGGTPLGTSAWIHDDNATGQTATISQYLTGFARVSFIIDNGTNNTAGTVTGVLIDGVYINPEPGTIALFGLGAAGLGAFAWRRRKAAKAAKTSA